MQWLRDNPEIVVYVLGVVVSVGYTLLGEAKNPRVHALFQLLQSLGFDPKKAAQAVATILKGSPK